MEIKRKILSAGPQSCVLYLLHDPAGGLDASFNCECLAKEASEPAGLAERRFDGCRTFYSYLQERKFQGGSGQISECMAEELGELVKMNSPVYRIDQTGDLVVVETLDKQTYKVSAQEDNKEGSHNTMAP